MSSFNEGNVFFYTKMKPNEIYSAADEYLSSPSRNSSFEQNPAPETEIQKPAEDPFYDLMMKFEEEQFIQNAPFNEISCHTLANDVAKIMSTSTSSPPRICSKTFFLPKLDFEKQFANVSVKLGEIINPSNFYIVFDVNNDNYEDLKQKMKEFYEKNPYPLPIYSDHLYATKLEATQEWERVEIVSHVDKFFCVYFLDKGMTSFIYEEKLLLLDDQFKHLPPRSAKAALFGFSDTKWSAKSITLFKALAVNQTHTALVYAVVEDVAQIVLFNDNAIINEEMKKFIEAEASVN